MQEKNSSQITKMRRFFVNPASRSRLRDTQTSGGMNGSSNEEGRAEKRPHLLTHCFSSRSSEAEHLVAIALGHHWQHLSISENMDYSGASGYDKQ